MDEIKYYEQKEEIEEALETLKLGKLEYLDKRYTKIPYVDLFSKQITLEEGIDNFKINIYKHGYLSEHPRDKALMKVEYDTEEFLDLIKIEKDCLFYIHPDEETIEGRKIKFLGMNIKKHSTWDEYTDQGDYEKNTRPAIILYGQRDDGKIFRIEAMETYGMCGSGYCSASWGECNIEEINKHIFNKNDLIIKPLDDGTFIEATRNTEGYGENLDISVKDSKGEEIFAINCEYDGGDEYYPSGTITFKVNENPYDEGFDSELKYLRDASFLNVDKDKFDKALNERDFFDLGNPNKNKSDELEY